MGILVVSYIYLRMTVSDGETAAIPNGADSERLPNGEYGGRRHRGDGLVSGAFDRLHT